ncbi:MAG: sigma-54-dependent Fis family transcriptional regulator [Ignavibacteriales bacterium]|nr:sigma-54-dependent Fis family transcriptional regulator [Ignavibacteriales bacterium]
MKMEDFQKKFDIIGKSRVIKDLIDITMQIAKSDISVLIYGESGVGKEIFAQAIHGYSNREKKNLVSVNCGAIPEGILESELFGHKKGSFTGAVEDRKGYFEIANGGTLFLDEIAEMPLTTQVKLLRILETKDFMRLGSENITKVDVRIIAATNKDLQKEVDAKRFRHDLYFRLKAVTLFVPPLRERKEDIPLLVDKFLKEYAERNKIQTLDIDTSAMEYILKYSWPGNIRELKNTIETACALTRDGMLSEEILKNLITIKQEEAPLNLPVHLNRSTETLDREMIYYALIELKKDLVELKDIIKESKEGDKNIDINHVEPLEKMEKEAIVKALDITKGNKKSAANLLEISERTLYRKIKNYGII